MNYIDIAIAIIVLLFTYVGYKKGIFISLLELVRYIIGVPLCFFISDRYTQPVYSSFVKPRALEYINKNIVDSSSSKEITESIKSTIDSLPSFIAQSIDLSQLKLKKTDVAEQILTKLFEPALISATKAVLFIIAFVLFFAVTGIVLTLITKARRRKEHKHGKSVLSKTDRLIGGAFGVVKSLVVVLLVASVLMFINDISADTTELSKQIDASHLLPLVEKVNPFDMIGGLK